MKVKRKLEGIILSVNTEARKHGATCSDRNNSQFGIHRSMVATQWNTTQHDARKTCRITSKANYCILPGKKLDKGIRSRQTTALLAY